jgi:simple sugar transport system permease protein
MHFEKGKKGMVTNMVKSKNKSKLQSNTFLLFITIGLFLVMYAAGMFLYQDKGFAKPQMFLNLFISNAGLIVIA